MYSKDLKNTLITHPHIKEVHFDAEGNHYFDITHIADKIKKSVSREDVLKAATIADNSDSKISDLETENELLKQELEAAKAEIEAKTKAIIEAAKAEAENKENLAK